MIVNSTLPVAALRLFARAAAGTTGFGKHDMVNTEERLKKSADNLIFAHSTCLFLGVGLVMWSVAPILIERMVSGMTPSLNHIFSDVAASLLGFAFIGLHVLIRRGVRWAFWMTFGLTAIMTTAGLALTTLHGIQMISTCLLMLSACACYASWLAIITRSRRAMQEAWDAAHPKRKSKQRMFLES
jgi:hypothetical protein